MIQRFVTFDANGRVNGYGCAAILPTGAMAVADDVADDVNHRGMTNFIKSGDTIAYQPVS